MNNSADHEAEKPANSAGQLSPDAAAALARSIAGTEACGLPLGEVLAALADDSADRRLASAAAQLATQTAQGVPLDEALAALGDQMPADIRGVLTAGVRSGNLADVLQGFAEHQAVYKMIVHTIRSAVAYPLLIACLFLPIAFLFTSWIIPMFATMYREFGLELPILTRELLKTADDSPVYFGVMLGVPLAAYLVLRVFRLDRLRHWLRSSLPAFGRLWTWAGQFEFAAMLATMLENQLPMPEAMENAASALHDKNVARASRLAGERIRRGQSLSAALADSIHFDPLLVRLAEWGESAAALPDGLRLAAEIMQARIKYRAALLSRMLPVFLLLVVGAFILGIVLISLLVPMVDLVRSLSGG